MNIISVSLSNYRKLISLTSLGRRSSSSKPTPAPFPPLSINRHFLLSNNVNLSNIANRDVVYRSTPGIYSSLSRYINGADNLSESLLSDIISFMPSYNYVSSVEVGPDNIRSVARSFLAFLASTRRLSSFARVLAGVEKKPLEYVYLWQVQKGLRPPSASLIHHFKDFLDENDWHTHYEFPVSVMSYPILNFVISICRMNLDSNLASFSTGSSIDSKSLLHKYIIPLKTSHSALYSYLRNCRKVSQFDSSLYNSLLEARNKSVHSLFSLVLSNSTPLISDFSLYIDDVSSFSLDSFKRASL